MQPTWFKRHMQTLRAKAAQVAVPFLPQPSPGHPIHPGLKLTLGQVPRFLRDRRSAGQPRSPTFVCCIISLTRHAEHGRFRKREPQQLRAAHSGGLAGPRPFASTAGEASDPITSIKGAVYAYAAEGVAIASDSPRIDGCRRESSQRSIRMRIELRSPTALSPCGAESVLLPLSRSEARARQAQLVNRAARARRCGRDRV